MDDLERYLEDAHADPHPLLLELEQHGRKDGIPIVSRETGRLLSTLVHAMQANRILEIGTAYGYSTLWMALAQPPVGTIWTIDPDVERTDVALDYFRRAGEDDNITIMNSPALEIMPNLEVRNLDIVYIDAVKAEYREYLDLAIPMLKRSGLVIVDDLLSDLAAMREFNEYFLNHPDLDATILPLGNGTGIGARVR
ncbi:MAG: O-methyltransferase [Candidatus Eremiobacteraeota bacterium]|nr:O-methyltransferase [Candidatus Eremiobacteraeota bacterium]